MSAFLAPGRRLPRALLAGLVALCPLWMAPSCESVGTARLLRLRSVSPAQWTDTTTLTVLGEGFPTGRTGRLWLRGRAYRPGARPEPLSFSLLGRAVGDGRLTAPIPEAVLAAFTGGGSFRGQLTLSFGGARAGTEVSGTLPVAFDVLAGTAQTLAARHRLRLRAQRFLTHLGIEGDLSAGTQDGLTVHATAPGSPAARAGLAAQDRIVRADGVGVHSVADLAPPPNPTTVRLEVLRPGHRDATSVRLTAGGFETPTLAMHLRPLCVLSALVLLLIFVLGPLPSLPVWLARCRSRLRHRDAASLWTRIWDDRPPSPASRPAEGSLPVLRRHAMQVLLPISVTAALLAAGLLHPLYGLHFNPLHVYLGITTLTVGLTLSLPGRLSRTERRRNARIQLSRMAVVGLSIGCACALGGTRSLAGIIDGQGGTPVRWLWLSQPAMFVLLPLYIVHASRIVPLDLGAGVRARTAVFVLDVGGRVMLSALGAAIFLGGYQTSGLPFADRLDPVWLGAGLFTLKAWGLGLLLHLRRALGPSREHKRVTALSGAAALLLTALWVRLDVSAQTTLAVGYVLGSASLGALLLALLQLVRSRKPMGSAPRYWVAEG